MSTASDQVQLEHLLAQSKKYFGDDHGLVKGVEARLTECAVEVGTAPLAPPIEATVARKRGREEFKAARKVDNTMNALETAREQLRDLRVRELKLEEKLQAASHKLRAFESKGEEQRVFADAADYADNWAKNADQEFNVFFICKGNQGEGWGTCNTLIQSKAWETLHADPMAAKQRWYCRKCGARSRSLASSSR